jgi:hypothetical protein
MDGCREVDSAFCRLLIFVEQVNNRLNIKAQLGLILLEGYLKEPFA